MVKLIERYIIESKEDWSEIRSGLFTASRINEIMASAKVLMTAEELVEYKKLNPKSTAKYKEDEFGIGEGAETYIHQIIRRSEGAPDKEVFNKSIEWGNEYEPQAALTYCQKYNYDIQSDDVIYTSQNGIVFFVGDNLVGCTPDLILPDRICQIKCPDSDTHFRYRLYLNSENFQETLPGYYDQIQSEMMLTERNLADFFSFDPRFKREVMQSHTVTLERNVERQNKIYKKAQLCEKRKQEILTMLPK
jgi:hypothetical protein